MFKDVDEIKSELNKNKFLKFKIKVCANAKSKSCEFLDEFIKIKITAQAIEGRANKAVVEYLSEIFNVAKTKIKIAAGEKSTIKIVEIKL